MTLSAELQSCQWGPAGQAPPLSLRDISPPLPGESTVRRFAVTAVTFAGTLHFAECKVPVC